jgi:hypothetical protein
VTFVTHQNFLTPRAMALKSRGTRCMSDGAMTQRRAGSGFATSAADKQLNIAHWVVLAVVCPQWAAVGVGCSGKQIVF